MSVKFPSSPHVTVNGTIPADTIAYGCVLSGPSALKEKSDYLQSRLLKIEELL